MAGESKTEKATPKKRRDERKEGHIFQSHDVANLALVAVSFFALSLLLPGMAETMSTFMKYMVDAAGTTSSADAFGTIAWESIEVVVLCMVPFMLICMVVGILATGVQTRFLFSRKSVAPKLSRMNPITGIKNLFSFKNAIELVKNIVKVIILLWIFWDIARDEIIPVARTMDMDITISASYMFDLIMTMVIRVSIVFVFIAVFDYLYQWWDYERNIRMSKEDLKEEYKQTEGNPEIKGKIKELQRQRARSRMMQAVPTADVVIKNPTHFAVALKYDIERDNAPKVVAKGMDELALRIIDVAENHNVITIENKPLARGLYATVEVGGEIPNEFYAAVAEILVYVFKLNKKGGIN